MMKKNILIVIAILSVIFRAQSQKYVKITLPEDLLRYKKALPVILEKSEQEQIMTLKIYLFANIEQGNPNVYLQLANLFGKRAKRLDFLTEYSTKKENTKEALKYLKLANHFLNKSTYRDNSRLFWNILGSSPDDKFSFDEVSAYVTKETANTNQYIANIDSVYKYFTSSFLHYENAHAKYKEILESYLDYKDLYLKYDSDLKQKLDEIKSEYLASMADWKIYKAITDTVKTGYAQKMSKKNITEYRLNGVQPNISFLKENIDVWDYEKWVDETQKEITKQIGSMRPKLNAEYNRQMKKIKNIQTSTNAKPLKTDKKVLFELRKFDQKSFVEAVYKYNEKLYQQKKQEFELTNLGSTISLRRKLFLNGQIITSIKDTDSILTVLRKRANKEAEKKYGDFIKTNFKSASNFKSIIRQKKSEDEKIISKHSAFLKNAIFDLLRDTTSKQKTYRYRRIILSEKPTDSYDLDSLISNNTIGNKYITTHKIVNFDSTLLLAGVFKKGTLQAFVSLVSQKGIVKWLKSYSIKNESNQLIDTQLGVITAMSGGYALVLNNSSSQKNELLLLDEQGTKTLSKPLFQGAYPRKILYNQLTNSFLIGFKGSDLIQNLLISSPLSLVSYNVVGDVRWTNKKIFKGNLVSIIPANKTFLAFGNFNEINNKKGRKIKAGKKSLDANVFAMRVNDKGEEVDLEIIKSRKSFLMSDVYRVSENCINIFGQNENIGAEIKLEQLEKTKHLILDKQLKILVKE